MINLKQFGKETTSDRFSKQIPAMYSKITGNQPPGYLIADIKINLNSDNILDNLDIKDKV